MAAETMVLIFAAPMFIFGMMLLVSIAIVTIKDLMK